MLLAMDGALSMMRRDAGEAPVLVVLMVLPLLLSLPRLGRSRFAALGVLALAGQLVVWFGYYALDVPNPGLHGALLVFALPFVVSVGLLVLSWVAAAGPRRSGSWAQQRVDGWRSGKTSTLRSERPPHT